MSEDLNEMIGYEVQSTAEWRREKAEQFPDDTRNIEAAEELERLGAQIDALIGSDIENQIRNAQDSINNLDDGSSVWHEIIESVSTELRSVGFHSTWTSAVEFLEWYRDLLNEKLQELIDRAVPAPDLAKEVEDDPTVKAAKRAYEEARAKALAERRKTL